MLSTRSQILDVARRLFAKRGFQNTSIREIAEQLGLTKTAVLYHFPAKADIVAALAEPFLRDLAAVLERAGTRWEVLEGLLDVYLEHRQLLSSNVIHDLTMLPNQAVTRRFVRLMFDANRVVAGPDPSLREKVRAAQAVAMLSDPVIAHADEPTKPLRTEVLRGVRMLYPD
jgi:AcrR family transcriptional regulator